MGQVQSWLCMYIAGKGWNELKGFAEISGNKQASTFANDVQHNLDFLKAFKQDSANFKTLCQSYLLDLMANAKRRAAEGKYDDGVARLYRSLELLEQIQLKTVHNVDTSKEPLSCIPPKLRDEFQKKHLNHATGKLTLPLHDSYRLLNALDDKVGKLYTSLGKNLSTLLNVRNNSILAHGINPVKKDVFDDMLQMILTFGDITESDLPVFPSIPSPY